MPRRIVAGDAEGAAAEVSAAGPQPATATDTTTTATAESSGPLRMRSHPVLRLMGLIGPGRGHLSLFAFTAAARCRIEPA
ncbi:hypothetical protein GCM10020358_00240 [Amorphoplanes nipponensis]|uniref:Uncharacterized protein n=1 Tax=Actinoplanes nipponensis TaxID=135950 RepID=A0A919MND5_9ACTN|nr:hypothetical protein Ani05nite_50050 [Actinoplanes nipponensis]